MIDRSTLFFSRNDKCSPPETHVFFFIVFFVVAVDRLFPKTSR